MQNNIQKRNNTNTKLNPPLKPLQLRNNLHLRSIYPHRVERETRHRPNPHGAGQRVSMGPSAMLLNLRGLAAERPEYCALGPLPIHTQRPNSTQYPSTKEACFVVEHCTATERAEQGSQIVLGSQHIKLRQHGIATKFCTVTTLDEG